MGPAARAYLLLGAIAIALYVAIGGSDLVYEGLGTAAWIVILVGTARNRPRRRRGWYLLAAAQFALATADIIYFSGYDGQAPFPSAADAFYLVGSLLYGGSLLALVAGREALRRDALVLADATVVSLAIGLFMWSAFFTGAIGEGDGLARLVSVAYPSLDLVLLTVLVRVMLEHGRRTLSYHLVVASVAFLVVSDAWYVVPALTDHYVAGTWRDAGWLASYVCAGAAALDPSMTVFVRRRFVVVQLRRVALLGAALVLVAIAEAVQRILVGHTDVYAFAAFGGLMAIFITLRLVGLVKALEHARRDALESERRFRMVFERAPIGISMGRDGMMSETNPALHRMLGYGADELARMHYTDVTHPDDRALSVQLELDAGNRDSFISDKQYVRKDGAAVDTRVHVVLDLDDGLGMSLIEDVTGERALEEQLRQAQKMEAVGKLAGGIAHDFNNLMTAVLGYSDLLLRRLEPEDPNREKIEAIRDASVRASDLTRQLLAFGRRQMLQVVEVDLRDVVLRMDTLLRRVIGEDIRLETLFGDEPVVVRADATQLEQVVMNLAVNARDAMPTGGTLTIGVVADEDAAILSVADDGEGIDEATRARIFEPFFTTKPVGAGSGLGLATVHGIVGQSGGTIDVSSALGSGTVFTIRLPLCRSEAVLPGGERTATLLTD